MFINVHLPSSTDQRMSTVMADLHSQLMRNRLTVNLAVFGDFNAHFGKEDLLSAEKEFVGRALKHELCNENGVILKSLMVSHSLRAINTFSTSSTVKTTWKRNDRESQLDHILGRFGEAGVRVQNVRATFGDTHTSDHKLLYGMLAFDIPSSTESREVVRLPMSTPVPSYGDDVGLELQRTDLKNGLNFVYLVQGLFGVQNYQAAIRSSMDLLPLETTVADKWDRIREVICLAANKSLDCHAPSSPRSRRALADFKSARCKAARPPVGASDDEISLLGRRVKVTRKNLFDAKQTHRLDECVSFFDRINDFRPQERMNKTYGLVFCFLTL